MQRSAPKIQKRSSKFFSKLYGLRHLEESFVLEPSMDPMEAASLYIINLPQVEGILNICHAFVGTAEQGLELWGEGAINLNP